MGGCGRARVAAHDRPDGAVPLRWWPGSCLGRLYRYAWRLLCVVGSSGASRKAPQSRAPRTANQVGAKGRAQESQVTRDWTGSSRWWALG